MNLYAESSAVLAWLLGESTGGEVCRILERAELVITSDLTRVECERALVRAAALCDLEEGDLQDRRRTLGAAAVSWHALTLADEVLERSRRAFSTEPVRTLDALHLASALVARSVLPELAVLTLDGRIRANARELGFEVLPSL